MNERKAVTLHDTESDDHVVNPGNLSGGECRAWYDRQQETGKENWVALAIFAAVVIVYTAFGGFTAVVITIPSREN